MLGFDEFAGTLEVGDRASHTADAVIAATGQLVPLQVVAQHHPSIRVQRRPVHGVLLLDKPLGLSSNDALQKVKWLLRAEKAGHTGTLDPLASGLLPLCFGAATKFSQASLDADKRYLATLKLGQTRRGGDLEGEVLQTRPVNVSRADVEAACARALEHADPRYRTVKTILARGLDQQPASAPHTLDNDLYTRGGRFCRVASNRVH